MLHKVISCFFSYQLHEILDPDCSSSSELSSFEGVMTESQFICDSSLSAMFSGTYFSNLINAQKETESPFLKLFYACLYVCSCAREKSIVEGPDFELNFRDALSLISEYLKPNSLLFDTTLKSLVDLSVDVELRPVIINQKGLLSQLLALYTDTRNTHVPMLFEALTHYPGTRANMLESEGVLDAICHLASDDYCFESNLYFSLITTRLIFDDIMQHQSILQPGFVLSVVAVLCGGVVSNLMGSECIAHLTNISLCGGHAFLSQVEASSPYIEEMLQLHLSGQIDSDILLLVLNSCYDLRDTAPLFSSPVLASFLFGQLQMCVKNDFRIGILRTLNRFISTESGRQQLIPFKSQLIVEFNSKGAVFPNKLYCLLMLSALGQSHLFCKAFTCVNLYKLLIIPGSENHISSTFILETLRDLKDLIVVISNSKLELIEEFCRLVDHLKSLFLERDLCSIISIQKQLLKEIDGCDWSHRERLVKSLIQLAHYVSNPNLLLGVPDVYFGFNALLNDKSYYVLDVVEYISDKKVWLDTLLQTPLLVLRLANLISSPGTAYLHRVHAWRILNNLSAHKSDKPIIKKRIELSKYFSFRLKHKLHPPAINRMCRYEAE